MKKISVGFIVRGKDGKFLLGRAEGHRKPYEWTVFKGQQEDGEDLITTAIRELKEETGIDINIDNRLNKNISTNYVFMYEMQHKDVYLYMLDDVEGALDNFKFHCSSNWGEEQVPEISDYRWFDLDEMEYYIFPSQRRMIDMLKFKYGKEQDEIL
jgi:8-oxo-dGTP pyrophosphatase MutT (NUDIX family)